jgi:hypothetical protein
LVKLEQRELGTKLGQWGKAPGFASGAVGARSGNSIISGSGAVEVAAPASSGAGCALGEPWQETMATERGSPRASRNLERVRT